MGGDCRAGEHGPGKPGVVAGGVLVRARGRRPGASGVRGGARATGAERGTGAPSRRPMPPRSGSFAPESLRAPANARDTCLVYFFARAMGHMGAQTGVHAPQSTRMVDWSKSFVAPGAGARPSPRQPTRGCCRPSPAIKEKSLAICSRGTKRLAEDGAGLMVWLMVTRARNRVNSWPRRTHLRSTSPIFSLRMGARECHEAVAILLE